MTRVEPGTHILHYTDAEVAEGWPGDDDLSVLLWIAVRALAQLVTLIRHLAGRVLTIRSHQLARRQP
jgi:hypothetical protein